MWAVLWQELRLRASLCKPLNIFRLLKTGPRTGQIRRSSGRRTATSNWMLATRRSDKVADASSTAVLFFSTTIKCSYCSTTIKSVYVCTTIKCRTTVQCIYSSTTAVDDTVKAVDGINYSCNATKVSLMLMFHWTYPTMCNT